MFSRLSAGKIEVEAFGGQSLGDGAADAAGSAGYQSIFFHEHMHSPFFVLYFRFCVGFMLCYSIIY